MERRDFDELDGMSIDEMDTHLGNSEEEIKRWGRYVSMLRTMYENISGVTWVGEDDDVSTSDDDVEHLPVGDEK